MSRYIRQLIEQGEHQHLDFKYAITDAKKIARTFSAFANTEGGRLLIGVKDNGSIAGVKSEEEAYMLESAAHIYCKPKIEYVTKIWKLDGKQVLEVIVDKSPLKPHLAPWKAELWRAYVRMGDENFIANAVQVEVWKKKRSNRPTLIKYTHTEKEILEFLQKNRGISLNGFCKLSKIKYPRAKRILTNLITVGIIAIDYSGKTTWYVLSETGEETS